MSRDDVVFDVVHPAFPLPTTAPLTLQGVQKDGFGEAVVACDMPEPCMYQSLDSCQKRFVWTHTDLARHPDVGLVLQVGNAEKFSEALGLGSLDPFFQSQQEGSMLSVIEEDEGDKRLVENELSCKADGVAPLDSVSSGHHCHC